MGNVNVASPASLLFRRGRTAKKIDVGRRATGTNNADVAENSYMTPSLLERKAAAVCSFCLILTSIK